LLPQGQILQEQIATRAQGPDKHYEQKPQQAHHGASLTRKDRRNWLHLYLADGAADRYFGETQVPMSATKHRIARVATCPILDKVPASEIGMVTAKDADIPVVRRFYELASELCRL
jgi:hypothetical protein